jgi:hypothetical protein
LHPGSRMGVTDAKPSSYCPVPPGSLTLEESCIWGGDQSQFAPMFHWPGSVTLEESGSKIAHVENNSSPHHTQILSQEVQATGSGACHGPSQCVPDKGGGRGSSRWPGSILPQCLGLLLHPIVQVAWDSPVGCRCPSCRYLL